MAEKKGKQVFDYREPFQAPYMVREITKNLKLPVAMYGSDITVFLSTMFIVGLMCVPILGFNRITVLFTLLIPYAMVQLFNAVEPDGKKVHTFVKDYLIFMFQWQIPKWELFHGKKIRTIKTKVVYKKITNRMLQVRMYQTKEKKKKSNL